jgi:3-hydroxyanthranilate 3,4-dioxygenase
MIDSLVPFDLKGWIEENKDSFTPPMGSRVLYKDPQLIMIVVGGPNTRGDFHVTDSPEFFYQIQGDIVIEYFEDGKRLRSEVKEGQVALIPAMVPHSPQRPAGTVGLVIERKRRPDEADGFEWYCNKCDAKLHQAEKWDGRTLRSIGELTAGFESEESQRTCKSCGHVQPVADGPRL